MARLFAVKFFSVVVLLFSVAGQVDVSATDIQFACN